jgi:SNF2 family DNA or RNA helicase
MTIYDEVKSKIKLPMELYPFQVDTVNELAHLQRAGYWLDVGCGKTNTSIVACLHKLQTHKIKHVICLMPPVLITNWSRVLETFPGVIVTIYRGTPKQRKELSLKSDFILMSYTIFKQDYERMWHTFNDCTVALLCDEAQALKNVGSQTHQAVAEFYPEDTHRLLLSGTPLSTPLDAYAHCKLKSPGTYLNLAQFERVHVEARDFFEKPIAWQNIDLLWDNMEINSKRILKSDVLKDLPAVTYQEIKYDLAPAHLKLYRQIADEQLSLLPEGEKLDMTQVSKLYYALSQVPCNAEHFSGGEVKSTILELLDEIMDELEGKKLVILTQYVMTNRRLIEHCAKYGVVAIYGEISPKGKQAAIDRFVDDPSCRIICIQYISGGAGVDALQHVCSDMLAVELPFTSSAFHQAIARLDRIGQTNPVTVRIALAEGTLMESVYDIVLEKDSLVNSCLRGNEDLRNVILNR